MTSAVSDLVILNIYNNYDWKFDDFFDWLSKLSKKLKGKNLFKGKLMILIRDVA